MYILCLIKEGDDGGYTWQIVQKTKAWQMFQNWWLLKRIHINLMGHLWCIFNLSKVKTPQLGLSLFTFKLQLKDDIIYHYSQLYNTMCVNSSKNYFKPKINAPISDNKRLNSLNFLQGTPCQSNNAHNVYGSKNHAHIKTNKLIYLNSINYQLATNWYI
jgi:hypothetical protein